MKNKISIVIALISLLTCSCRYRQVKDESPSVNTVKPGEKFRINLPENHTTGYTWQLSQDYDNTVLTQMNEVWHGNEKGVDFNLLGGAAGQTTLTFVNRKYTDTSDVKHFIVKIGAN